MKKLILGIFALSGAYAQVIEQDINCHQGLIDLTVVDTSNIPGTYHLSYFDGDWQLLQGAYVVDQPDTFYITFSGIGTEMHTYDSMYVEFNDSPLISFNVGCGGKGIKPVSAEIDLVSIHYYNLSGVRILEPKGLYIEVRNFRTHQTVSKKYAGDW